MATSTVGKKTITIINQSNVIQLFWMAETTEHL